MQRFENQKNRNKENRTGPKIQFKFKLVTLSNKLNVKSKFLLYVVVIFAFKAEDKKYENEKVMGQ